MNERDDDPPIEEPVAEHLDRVGDELLHGTRSHSDPDLPENQPDGEGAESDLPEVSKGTARPAIADESAAPDKSGSAGHEELGSGAD